MSETLESNVLITLMVGGQTHYYLYFNPTTDILVVEQRVNLKIVGSDRMKDSSPEDYRAEIKVMKELGYQLASTSETDLF